MADEDVARQLAEAQAEILRLQAEAEQRGASGMAGPGTPEHFYAVGGNGETVPHPETGEPLLNPQSGAPIIQEHPRVAAQMAVDAAQVRVDQAEESLNMARTALGTAQAELAGADDRYAEIVAHLVSQQTPPADPAPESEG